MLKNKLNLRGEFTLRVRQGDAVVREVGPFSNLITDIGLSALKSLGNPNRFCYVGTGTAIPAETDTTMSSYLATSNSTGGSTRVAPSSPAFVAQEIRTFTFNAGTISGNITEVGVGWNSSPVNSLWSRELIVDSEGNPITLTVLPTEILDVVYTRTLAVPQTDTTGSFIINSITYNYVMRAANAGSWKIGADYPYSVKGPSISTLRGPGSVLGAITGSISGGTSGASSSPSGLPYGTLTANARTNMGLTVANVGGITTALIVNYDSQTDITYFYQMSITPAIPKTSLSTLTIDMAITWGRG